MNGGTTRPRSPARSPPAPGVDTGNGTEPSLTVVTNALNIANELIVRRT